MFFSHCHLEQNTDCIKKAKKDGKLKKLNYISDKISPIVPIKVESREKEEILEDITDSKYIFPFNRLMEINEHEKSKLKEDRNAKF